MHVLILGFGYVGRALAAKLIGSGHEVTGLRRKAVVAEDVPVKGLRLLNADITDAQSLLAVAAAYDWVVLCVSASGGGPRDYERAYVHGTKNVLKWLAAAPPGKLVYTSSTSVYGQTDGSCVDEDSPTEPRAETARVLLEAENVLLEPGRS